MSSKLGGFWKPDDSRDVPTKKYTGKLKKNRGKKKKRRERLSNGTSKDFYKSNDWQMLRVRVLEKYSCCCMMCGMSPKEHGIVIHVDHIKPRSKHPELSLDFNNLQLLCEDCNIGKMNRYETDYRPDDLTLINQELDEAALENMPHF